MNALNYLFISAVCIPLSFMTANAPKVKDYLSIPGPIDFKQVKYLLAWSSHPSITYYKQEYLPVAETPGSYHQMIMAEALDGEIAIEEVIRGKIDELEQRKRTDPMTNYQVSANRNKDEYLLDFIISQSGQKGLVAEWNAYRYIKLKLKSGKTAILLLAYSKRVYEHAVPDFLRNLKKERLEDLAALSSLKIPLISVIH